MYNFMRKIILLPKSGKFSTKKKITRKFSRTQRIYSIFFALTSVFIRRQDATDNDSRCWPSSGDDRHETPAIP